MTNYTNSPKSILSDMSFLSQKISSLIKSDKPNLFIVLGDRHETLAVSLAALKKSVAVAAAPCAENVFSKTLPVSIERIFVRTKAGPLPGFTCKNSMIL